MTKNTDLLTEQHRAAARIIDDACGELRPKVALILGSGLGKVSEAVEVIERLDYKDLPGFPELGVGGHSGTLSIVTLDGHPLIVLNGRCHYYEQADAAAMAPIIGALKASAVETLIITNAAGSLLNQVPGSIMLIKDYLNFTGQSPLFGCPHDQRFVNMANAYNADFRYYFKQIARQHKIPLSQGVYAWMAGPQFETPAEIKAIRQLGADAVGMSTVPETILARYHGMKVAGLSVITNYGAGMDDGGISHDQTLSYAPKAANDMKQLIAGFLDHYYA